ncbi:DNA primase, partial [Candidatus Uhrbacteria bacterium]|nr:DNA primase [Candidatus Uhrbacteria bacterium]
MSTTDEVKQRIDIVDLVGEYVKLKPAGGSNFKAACPFHREKTPSFYVSRDKQLWYCFGCGAGGDHFAFVMQLEGLDFSEALRQLAEKAGVEVKRFITEHANIKTRLLSLVDLAARFYHKCLLEAEGAAGAREYLKTRGLTNELIEKFQLGYAPDRWDGLVGFLAKKGYREQEMIEAGVAVRRQDRTSTYDRFRHRIMFPVADARGKVVGFSGRLLDPTRDEGKYINTPQTLLYNKSQLLYGLHLAKTAIKEAEAVVVVEGNMDVIASHKAGVDSVVASSGTALTTEQLALIRRFTETIALCFDADLAGENAAKRGIDLALEAGMNVRVITLPEGTKDPDDLVSKNPSAWKETIRSATDVMTYYFNRTFTGGAPQSGRDKKHAGHLLLPEIARLADPIERAHWTRELARRLGVTEAVLEEGLMKYRKGGEQKKEVRAGEVLTTHPADRRSKLADEFVAMLLARDDLAADFVVKMRPEYLPEPHQSLYLLFMPVYHGREATAASDERIFAVFRKIIEIDSPGFLSHVDRLAMVGEERYRG